MLKHNDANTFAAGELAVYAWYLVSTWDTLG